MPIVELYFSWPIFSHRYQNYIFKIIYWIGRYYLKIILNITGIRALFAFISATIPSHKNPARKLDGRNPRIIHGSWETFLSCYRNIPSTAVSPKKYTWIVNGKNRILFDSYTYLPHSFPKYPFDDHLTFLATNFTKSTLFFGCQPGSWFSAALQHVRSCANLFKFTYDRKLSS